MWNKYLTEGEFALLQSVGGDTGCVSSGPAFQTAGMKHAVELAALLHCWRESPSTIEQLIMGGRPHAPLTALCPPRDKRKNIQA